MILQLIIILLGCSENIDVCKIRKNEKKEIDTISSIINRIIKLDNNIFKNIKNKVDLTIKEKKLMKIYNNLISMSKTDKEKYYLTKINKIIKMIKKNNDKIIEKKMKNINYYTFNDNKKNNKKRKRILLQLSIISVIKDLKKNNKIDKIDIISSIWIRYKLAINKSSYIQTKPTRSKVDAVSETINKRNNPSLKKNNLDSQNPFIIISILN